MKRLLCVFGLLFCLSLVYAQSDDDIPLPKSLQTGRAANNIDRKVKFMVGGSFGFQIGTYTAIEVAPKFGIYATDFLAFGITGTYMFMHTRAYNLSLNSHTFGGGAFVEGYVWKRLILHASYEYLNFDALFIDNANQVYVDRVGNHGILVGPGYRQKVGERVNIFALILFPVYQSQHELKPYSIPVYKVGVTVDI